MISLLLAGPSVKDGLSTHTVYVSAFELDGAGSVSDGLMKEVLPLNSRNESRVSSEAQVASVITPSLPLLEPELNAVLPKPVLKA